MKIDRRILDINSEEDKKVLRDKISAFDFDKFSKSDINNLIKTMREVMDEADGVGLAANQIGLDMAVFVVGFDGKFYAIFNPEIIKASKEKEGSEEGCLSIPGHADIAYRHEKITLIGYDKNQKKIKIKAWGLLARIFQHEIDHLNGKLFIDRVKK